ATSEALAALGLAGCVIRVNDRRILFGLLAHCGFAPAVHEAALITIDKLDKIGAQGVLDELREVDAEAADRMGAFLGSAEESLRGDGIPLEEHAIRGVLPAGASEAGLIEGSQSLVELGATLSGGLPESV